jgi:hypothetical protein
MRVHHVLGTACVLPPESPIEHTRNTRQVS